jgi:hypothetical protein
MTNPANEVDQVLKTLATQSIKQGSNVRATVRNLTLKALQQRELTLKQIGKVLRSIVEGVHVGVAKREMKVEKALSDTIAGLDDALLKAVKASNVALHRVTGKGYDYEDSNLRQALNELEKLEDEFIRSLVQATDSAAERVRAPWQRALEKTTLSGTATGSQVASTMRDHARRAQAAMRTLASGILIGMSEGLGTKRHAPTTGKTRRTTKAGKRPPARSVKGVTAKTAKRPGAKRPSTTAARRSR